MDTPLATETISRTYLLPQERIDGLERRVEAVARRALKHGLPAPRLLVGDWVACYREKRGAPIVKLSEVTLEGERATFDGWRFGASIQHYCVADGDDPQAEGGTYHWENVLLGVEDIPPCYRVAAPSCDHCKTSRRRAETFVLLHEDGRAIQVGRDCIGDFLPGVSVHDWASAAEWLATLFDDASEASDLEGGGSLSPIYQLAQFMACVVCAVRNEGSYQPNVTRSAALSIMFPPKPWYPQPPKPTDDDRARAAELIAWAKGLSDEECAADYKYNLRTIARSGIVDIYKTAGLAASIVVAHNRDLLQARAVLASHHVGQVGDKVQLTLRCDRRFELLLSAYGGVRYALSDDAGNVFTWVTNAAHLVEGERYELKGTIKRHSEWKGVKQTELTRCKTVLVPRGEAA